MRYYLTYVRDGVKMIAGYATPQERDKIAAELLMHGGAVHTYAKELTH